MSFPRYPAYKDHEDDWIDQTPTTWSVRSLRHQLLNVFNGVTADQIDPSDATVPVTRIETISSGRIDWERVGHIARTDARADRKLLYGDICFSNINSLNVIGNCAIYEEAEELYGGMNLLVLRPARNVDPKYLYWVIKSTGFRSQVESSAKPAINQASISQSSLLSIPTPYPSLAEQKCISIFLDRETAKIDALVAEQEQLISLLKEKRQAVISHAVTKGLDPSVPMKDSGIEWLGEVPAHWEVVRVKHLVKSFEQGWSPQCENFPVESASDWGVLKVGCVNGGIFNPEENKALPADLTPLPELGISSGDLLISRANTRELVGSAAVALVNHQNLMLCDKLYRLRLDPALCLPAFLSLFLGTERARGQIELAATGASSSMLNISQSTILDMCLALPPVAEQQELLHKVDESATQFDQLIDEAVLSIELLRERRSALISAAVTGQIDVRGLLEQTEKVLA